MFSIISKMLVKAIQTLDWQMVNALYSEQGYLDAAVKAVGGDGFDVIVENASHINLAADLNVIAPGARVVVSIRLTFFTSKKCVE